MKSAQADGKVEVLEILGEIKRVVVED